MENNFKISLKPLLIFQIPKALSLPFCIFQKVQLTNPKEDYLNQKAVFLPNHQTVTMNFY